MLRSLLLVAALGGCYGGYVDANLHPAVAPKLSELPDDKRDATLDAAAARPNPEQRRKDLTPRARKLELAAAIMAAIIGDASSHSHNVTIGLGSEFDETGNLHTRHTTRPPETARLLLAPDAGALVPWVKVAPPMTETSSPPTE